MYKEVCRIADNENTPDEQSFPVYDGVSDYNFFIYPPLKTPRLLPNVLRVYSHLLGFDAPNKRFNLVPCDSNGRLFVNEGPIKAVDMLNNDVVVTPIPVVLVRENPHRKKLIISNFGCAMVRLFLIKATQTDGRLRLQPGSVYVDDMWNFEIMARTDGHSVLVSIIEFT